jgi:hypothetical protein
MENPRFLACKAAEQGEIIRIKKRNGGLEGDGDAAVP